MARGVKQVRTAVRWAQPLAVAVVNAQRDAHQAGRIVVVDAGDATAAERLAAVLEAPVGTAVPGDMLVGVAVPGAEHAELAALVGDHRRAGGEAVIIVVGNAVERRAIERELSTDQDVGISVMLFVDSLSHTDVARVRRRVADLIITSSRGFRRRYRSSQSDIARRMDHRLALRLAIRSGLVGDAAKTAQGMKSGHASMVAETTGMSDAGFDPKHAGLVAAVALLAPVWRHGSGRLTAFVPFTRIAVRGGLAYSVTRLVGIGAQRLAMHGREPHQEDR